MSGKKICAALLLIAAAFAAGAEAAKRKFGPIEADVPAGWEVEETDDQLTFTAPDNAAVLTILVGDTEGAPLKDIAQGIAQQLNGSVPKAEGSGYEFAFKNPNGVDCYAFIGADEDAGYYISLVAAGEHPQLQGLIKSLDFIN